MHNITCDTEEIWRLRRLVFELRRREAVFEMRQTETSVNLMGEKERDLNLIKEGNTNLLGDRCILAMH